MSLTPDPSVPRIFFHNFHGSDCPQVVVYFPGIFNDGSITAFGLMMELKEYGNVIVVNYPERGFNTRFIVDAVLDNLTKVKSVVFVGASMGASLAGEVIERLGEDRPDIDVKLIALCGLLSHHDTAQSAKPLTHAWVRPFLAYPVFRWIDAVTTRRDHLEIEKGVNPAILREHRKSIRRVTASAKLAQLRFVEALQGPSRTSDIRCAYVSARTNGKANDGFVSREAIKTFRFYYPRTAVFNNSELRHCDFVEQPEAWSKTLGLVFWYIGVLPLTA